MRPPLLPLETLTRVYRLARRNGLGVLLIAGAFAIGSAVMGDRFGAVVGLLVAGSGAMELHGTHRLREGEIDGMRWLIFSQLYLLVVMLGYCAYMLTHFQPELVESLITPEIRSALEQAGQTIGQFKSLVEKCYYLIYGLVGCATLAYQGGLATYYTRRRRPAAIAIEQAESGED